MVVRVDWIVNCQSQLSWAHKHCFACVLPRTHVKQLGIALREMGNFNALKMVLSGLQCQTIFRLRKSWSHVSDRWMKKFESLEVCLVRHRGII